MAESSSAGKGVYAMSSPRRHVTRRNAMKLGAATAALPLVHIRTAGAAGKLRFAIWDHWVPTGDAAMKKLVDDWAEKNKVAVELDFLTGVGMKINITMAAEAQAKTGHDIFAFDQWTVQQYADSLDPMDDVMQRLIGKYGKLGRAYEYLGVVDKHWKAVPVGWGSAPLTPCGRISLLKKFANFDVQAMYPAHETTPDAGEGMDLRRPVEDGGSLLQGRFPDRLRLRVGQHRRQPDLGRHVRCIRRRSGERQGRDHRRVRQRHGGDGIRAEDDQVHAARCGELGRCLEQPRPDLGQGGLYLEPALGLGGRQARRARCRGGLLDLPQSVGSEGPAGAAPAVFLGHLVVRAEQGRGEGPDRASVAARAGRAARRAGRRLRHPAVPVDVRHEGLGRGRAAEGHDLQLPGPAVAWSEYYIPGSSAPPEIAVQIWNRYLVPGMVARLMSGQTIKQTVAWAKEELEGFVR